MNRALVLLVGVACFALGGLVVFLVLDGDRPGESVNLSPPAPEEMPRVAGQAPMRADARVEGADPPVDEPSAPEAETPVVKTQGPTIGGREYLMAYWGARWPEFEANMQPGWLDNLGEYSVEKLESADPDAFYALLAEKILAKFESAWVRSEMLRAILLRFPGNEGIGMSLRDPGASALRSKRLNPLGKSIEGSGREQLDSIGEVTLETAELALDSITERIRAVIREDLEGVTPDKALVGELQVGPIVTGQTEDSFRPDPISGEQLPVLSMGAFADDNGYLTASYRLWLGADPELRAQLQELRNILDDGRRQMQELIAAW